MKPARVYFVCSLLGELYCLKVFSFQLMKKRGVSIFKLMGMCSNPKKIRSPKGSNLHIVEAI
ncbi:hypothetical protein FNE58_02385 [Bacillus thuringiensis]|nr:hypothetical protein [Bacillus thuringiensis]